ncbi:MAG: cysteine--tRNA ligase, partial [Methanobacteriota archaeon]
MCGVAELGLWLYNTKRRRKELFKPCERGVVRVYVCGPTVYDLTHMGHARSYVFFDVLRRYLNYLGYKTVFVQNFSDISDMIEKKAEITGKSPPEVAETFIKEFFLDMDRLGVLRADHYPKASQYVEKAVKIVERLVSLGVAYETERGVYLRVEKKDFGLVTDLDPESFVSEGSTTGKKGPLDVLLWCKRGKTPNWPSPWGRGIPGWDLECFTMSKELLGHPIDIHGGGLDLIFPHHENNALISKALQGEEHARYYVHHGLVLHGDEKMSKSLGVYVRIRDALKKHDPKTLRFFILKTHYHKPLRYNEEDLKEACYTLHKLRRTVEKLGEVLSADADPQQPGNGENTDLVHQTKKDVLEALNDDVNTEKAINKLVLLAKDLSSLV